MDEEADISGSRFPIIRVDAELEGGGQTQGASNGNRRGEDQEVEDQQHHHQLELIFASHNQLSK